MAESPKFDPMAGSVPIKKNAPSSGFDPMAGSVPFKKKEDTELSGVKPSTDTSQEEDGFLNKLYSGTVGVVKNLIDTTPILAKGLARLGATGFSAGVGAPSMDIMAETKGEPVKRKTKEELLAGASETVEQLIPYEKQKLAKGTSSITELYKKGYITSGDAENIGYQLADGIVQMGIGAIPAVGGILLYAKNFEQRFEDTKAKGISDDRAYQESAVGALIETAIEKNIGVDKLIAKGLGKTVSKEAIKDISGALLSREAFQETAKKYAKSFSFENIKQGFKKGFLPESIEEFAQTYIDGGEQDLFDYYERKRKEGDPNAKLALYDAKDEEGIFSTVNPETGKAELTPSFKSKTLLGALDAAFYGGLTGQMGGMFVESRSFNPSIYSTLQNAYDSQGKEGLITAVETVKKGLTKANENGKLEVDPYNNAVKNVDKIAANVAKFEQNSDINSYSRYVLYDHQERVIPETAQRIARVLAEATTPLELPTQDQIDDNIKNGEVSVVPFEQENQIPDAYKPYVQVQEDENGNKSIEATIPKSVVDAYNTNQVAVEQAMNNPLFSIDSLTNNNRVITIDDLKRIGQQGGIQGDLASQLNFNIIFEANRNNFAKGLRAINYAKDIVNTIAGGQTVEAADLRAGYMNIASFSQGDTVFYNNKSAKVMDISPNGQKLKLSGIQEEVDANDDNLRLQDTETEQAIQPEKGQVAAPTESTQVVQPVAPIERAPLAEEEQITGRTIRDAVGELIPFSYKGETGEVYTQSNGVVVFESPNRIYEFGNIKDIGDMSIDEFDIVPQEMSIGNNYSVTIDGKTFTNKNQNPFKAITYDAEGNAVSIKLENEKGQTRVIKGTRAVVIDAKYKVKKLYDESTREQLAAAADEAARQAATTEESGGQPTEAPTTAEGKPIEQAPSIAERENINRVRAIAARLAAEETPEMTGNRQAVANLTSSLFTAGIPVEVMNAEQIRIKYGKNVSQGMFISKNGTIVINESVLASEWGKTIIFHEGTHPIINIIRNTEPKLYKQLVNAIKEEAKTNPEVNKILQQVKAVKQYGDEFTRNDELVVEAIARVASGKLKLNDVKPTLRQAIVDFINKIAKAMGLRQVLKDTNQVAFNKLANQISEVLNAGRDISEIVGAKNVGKFNNSPSEFTDSDGNVLTNGDVQFNLFNELDNTQTGFTLQYVKDSNSFIGLVNDGVITNNKTLKDFAGDFMFLHAPDAAFSGNLLKDGKVIVKGKGGIFYPINNYLKNLIWASTSTAVDKLVAHLNDNAKKNNGKILFGLVSTDPTKLLSSTTASVGTMDLFIEKAKDNTFDISEEQVKKYLVSAFLRTTKIEKTKGQAIEVSFKNIDKSKLDGDLNSIRDYISSVLSPDTSSFDERKFFVHRFLEEIASNTEAYSTLANQLGNFFHIEIDNKAFKGLYKSGYKISKENLIDNVSNLFTEPLLKGQESGGKVYAVIEVSLKKGVDKSKIKGDFSNLVSGIESDSHESYPNAVKLNDDNFEVKVHILQDREIWYQNTINPNTNKIVGEKDYKRIMPTTAGITMGSVKVSPQYSDIDRTYSMESTVADAGMTMAEKEAWQEKNRVSQRQERNPLVQQAADALSKGLATLDEYVSVVRANMPIYSMPEVPKIPTFKEIVGALNKQALDKGGIVGLNKTFKDGERVASRLDIPAYNAYDTWVVSIHDGINNRIDGKVLGYGQTAVLKNVEFGTMPSAAMNIAIDKNKATIARIFGNWVNESPQSAHKRATELMNDPEWTQVGMNPYRHSFFYDKNTGEALISADEVIQVGALVLAKNVVRAPFGSQAFNDHFTFVNKLGERVQFSELNRDDKRIQIIRKEFSTAPKTDIVAALMGEPFNLSQEKAEDLVNRAFADPLAPSIPTGNPDTTIPEGSKLNEKSKTVEEYNSGYDKYKKSLLERTSNLWEETKKYIALQYDSRFFARRKLSLASSEASLAQAQLRNLNGIAYSASQELAGIFENIFGNGLSENGIKNLDAVIFNLRVLQLDRNTEAKYQDEVEKLTVDFINNNGRVPSDRESIGIASQARKLVPLLSHGKTKDGIPATSKTSEAFLNALRQELGENEFNMLKARADMFRKVGNNEVEKLRKAGIISQEVADSYKDDFYALRMTLDRLYGKEDPSILMMNGVPSIKGWAALSKEGTENYISQDSRLMLAQSYIGTARAIAKNAFRESVFNENIKIDENGNQQSVIGINGQRITFIKPADYIRDAEGNIRSNGKELSVREPSEGYVNVPFKRDGVINYFQMEKETFNQIEGNNIVWRDNPSDTSKYYSVTDFANKILTGFATRKNPFFFIGNVPMDLQQQIFFTDIWTQGSLVQSNVYSAGARAIVRTIKFTNFFGFNTEFRDKTLEEYIAAGGAMDKMSTMKEQRQRSIEISLVGKSKSTGGKLIKDKMKSFFFGMNERTEIAMRLAAYDQSKKNLIKKFEEENNGASPNEQQMEKIQEIAAAKSRAYTDFAQRGTSLPNLNVAYLNSSIQAAGAASEYVYDNPVKAAEKLSQLVIGKYLGTLAIMALMGDAYDELDEYRKDMYSFIFSKDTGKKDANGKPIYATADIRNNPLLIPILSVSRTMAEKTMRAFQGKEQEDVTYLGTADRFFDLISQASPIPVPNITSLKGLEESAKRLFTKHIFFNLGAKMLMGYDAFRNKDIVSEKDKSLSPYMQGQDDPNIPYFYKVMAKSMSSFSSSNQVSPAIMQSVAETFITSPRTNIFVALGYGVLSDVANVVIPAKTEKERGEFSLWDTSKALKSITSKFASYTDSEKAEFRKNEQLYIQSKEESMKYNDQERVIDNQLKELQKNDSQNFFKNLDSFIEKEGYDENSALANRVKTKAASLYKKDVRANLVNEDMMNEVRILHYTQGAEGKAKLMKYMFESDKDKVEEVLKSLIYYGSPAREVYEARDIYNKSIEK